MRSPFLPPHRFFTYSLFYSIESSSGAAGRSAERERRLREHPHAKVLGPQAVECGLCKKEIRLSTKSAYDPFHWTKHIDRCAKLTPAERAARVERTNKTADRVRLLSAPLPRSPFPFSLRR